MDTSFNERLRTYRESIGLSQRDMAKKFDLTQAAYGHIEKEGKTISVRMIEIMSQNKMPVEWIIFGDNKGKTAPNGSQRLPISENKSPDNNTLTAQITLLKEQLAEARKQNHRPIALIDHIWEVGQEIIKEFKSEGLKFESPLQFLEYTLCFYQKYHVIEEDNTLNDVPNNVIKFNSTTQRGLNAPAYTDDNHSPKKGQGT